MGTKQNNFKAALNELMAGKLEEEQLNTPPQARAAAPVQSPSIETAPAASASTPMQPEPTQPDPIKATPTETILETHTYPRPSEPVAEEKEEQNESHESVFKRYDYTPIPSSSPTGMSVITSDLIIDGNVTAKSNIRIDGQVKGNVTCEGSITCGGLVEGDIQCDSLTMTGCSVNGNINAKSDVSIDADSILIGDVIARNFLSNGRMKGNIQTTEAASLKDKAMLMGNISAKSVSLDAGACLRGTLNVQTADISDEDFNFAGVQNLTSTEAPSLKPKIENKTDFMKDAFGFPSSDME